MTPQSEERAKPETAGGGPKRLSLGARRAIVAVVGGLLAFGAGTGMAFAFRVSPDVTVADAVDPTVADELPSEAAARAYALNNPPNYAVQVEASPDVGARTPTDDVYAAPSGSDDDAAATAEPPSDAQPGRAAVNDDGVAPPAAAFSDGSDRTGAAGPSD